MHVRAVAAIRRRGAGALMICCAGTALLVRECGFGGVGRRISLRRPRLRKNLSRRAPEPVLKCEDKRMSCVDCG